MDEVGPVNVVKLNREPLVKLARGFSRGSLRMVGLVSKRPTGHFLQICVEDVSEFYE